MNKIYKVIYSKVRQCYVVVSEIAKSHGRNTKSSVAKSSAVLTAAVLVALGSFSIEAALFPATADAAIITTTKTSGSNFVGVERTDGLFKDSDYANHDGQGAHGDNSITIGLKAVASEGTITIGDRDASTSLGSVYVGRGPGMPRGKTMPTTSDKGYWATSVGYQSDATGYGSIAIGSNATANNSYDKDSTEHGIQLRVPSGDGSITLNGKPDIQRASVAIGYGANADNGNIAIGSYSDASTDLRTVADDTAKAYLTEETADSYVSVGKTGALRRISNVADGAADSDVATIGQLKALSDKAGVYNEGWGIKIDKTNGNTISVNHNLGNNMNAQLSSTGLILGGDFSNTYDGKYGGAAGDYAVTLGGTGNTASGESSVVTGGAYNTASGTKSFVGGGHGNIAVGDYSAVIGGWDNRALGDPYGSSITTVVGGYRNTANGYHAMVTGGYQNVAWGRDTLVSGGRYNTVLGEMEDGWTDQRLSDASAFGGEGSVVQGLGSVGLAGGSTGKTAYLALAAGYQSVVTDGAAKLEANFSDYEILPVYKDIASAIGYQSTANEAGTISFGHDAGDVSGYTVNWEEDKDPTHDAIDYGSNDYTKTPTVTENHYDDAYYNRLVKVADGIDNHDAVTREQVQYIGGIYGTDKNDSNYGGRGATGTNSVAIGSNAVATEDNVVSFGNPDIPAVNIPESRKITHSVSLSDTDKTAINNVLGFDVTNDENWSKISGLKDFVIVSSRGSATYAQDIQKLANNPEFMELSNKVNTALQNGTLTQAQFISFEKYANGTEVETTDAVNIPTKAANYRRVVNMADGINPHDAVAMEQLEDYAKTDASNIGVNLKGADGKAASAEAQKANAEKWGSAIGTGKIEKDNGQLVTGKTVYEYNKPIAEDGKKLKYVSEDKTTGQNLGALDSQVKTNADNIAKNTESIQDITNNMQNLNENAVKYDDSSKSTVTLGGGEGGTTITNVKGGTLSNSSTEAVNGKQLYNEQQAREAADKAITEKVTNNTNEITKIKNGDFTDASKTAIHNIAKDAVAVVNGKNTTVTKVEGTDTTPTTYAVNVEGTGKVASGDTGLISGDTLYKEVHIDKDGAYIKGSQSVGQNLSNLDTGLKTTSDLIHTNTKGDTIQIGGDSKATKIDMSGKDANGKMTGRVITGVVSDVNDPNSAANVGYVNGITSASNEQIYHDMNMQYNHVENDISRAAAGSNALAALHPMQEFDPDDKAQFALGYGHYRNSNAGAVGAFYQPDENSMVNFGVSFGNGDAGINAGVTFKFGPGGSGHHALTKTQMAKVIDAQSKEIDELKKDNADKDKRIDALEQKMTEILAKLDKSKD